jgi:hypothetical protein
MRGAHEPAVCGGRRARWPLDRNPTIPATQTTRVVIRASRPSDQDWMVRIGH